MTFSHLGLGLLLLQAGAALAVPVKQDLPVMQMTLLKTGSAPRQTLRYAFKAHSTFRLETLQRSNIQIGVSKPLPSLDAHKPSSATGMPSPSAELGEPAIVVRTLHSMKIHTAKPDLFKYSVLLTDARVTAGSTYTDKVHKRTIGFKVEGTLSARGLKQNSTFTMPGGPKDNIHTLADPYGQSVLQIVAIPLPTEAIGVGGEWSTSQAFKKPFQATRLISTYRVVRIDLPNVYLAVTESLKSKNGPASARSVGTWQINLNTPFPVQGHLLSGGEVRTGEKGFKMMVKSTADLRFKLLK